MPIHVVSLDEIADAVLNYSQWCIDDVIRFKATCYHSAKGEDLLLVHHSDYLKCFDISPFSLKERVLDLVGTLYNWDIAPAENDFCVNSIDLRSISGEDDEHLSAVLRYYDDEGLPKLLHCMFEKGKLYSHSSGFSASPERKYSAQMDYLKEKTSKLIAEFNKLNCPGLVL